MVTRRSTLDLPAADRQEVVAAFAKMKHAEAPWTNNPNALVCVMGSSCVRTGICVSVCPYARMGVQACCMPVYIHVCVCMRIRRLRVLYDVYQCQRGYLYRHVVCRILSGALLFAVSLALAALLLVASASALAVNLFPASAAGIRHCKAFRGGTASWPSMPRPCRSTHLPTGGQVLAAGTVCFWASSSGE